MNRAGVIVNPKASKGRGEKSVDRIRKAFSRRGLECRILMTEAAGDGLRLARQCCLDGFDVVVAAGGDGCVNEVVNGIMESGRDAAMGIIPIGRGNDFAWAAGIPGDIDSAVSLMAEGEAGRIDVGYLEGGIFPGGRYFLNGTGFGFEPSINFKAAEYRLLNGMPSYIVAFFHCLLHLPEAYDLTMTIDGEDIRLSSQQISVCNGRRMGSAFILAPHARLDDGLLDIVYASYPVRRRDVIPMVLSFLRGTQLEKCRFMEEKRGREVMIHSDRPELVIHTDGEFVSLDANCATVRILPSALRLFHTRQ